MLLVGALLLALLVLPPPWGLVVVVAAAVVEVGEALFWIRLSKRRKPVVGAEALVGGEAVVVSALRPEGEVRIHGELWRARSERGADPGERVRVRAVEGLTLFVE